MFELMQRALRLRPVTISPGAQRIVDWLWLGFLLLILGSAAFYVVSQLFEAIA